MPSTLVHAAFSGMIAAALLGAAFDRRSLFVVVGLTAAADLDAFVGLVLTAGHRTVGHTLVLPALAALAVAVDERTGGRLRSRFGPGGVRVAWVSVFAFVVSAVGLDLFTPGGANPLWPLHDQFYMIDGKVELSNRRGVIQTFVDLSPDPPADAAGDGGGSGGTEAETEALGSSEEVFVSTGVDPQAGSEPENVERIFPVVRSGWQLLLLVVGTTVTAARLRMDD